MNAERTAENRASQLRQLIRAENQSVLFLLICVLVSAVSFWFALTEREARTSFYDAPHAIGSASAATAVREFIVLKRIRRQRYDLRQALFLDQNRA